MTDEQRLGLPEEPPRELYSNLMLLSDHHATWGAAWREKALELEKERDELRAQLNMGLLFGKRRREVKR